MEACVVTGVAVQGPEFAVSAEDNRVAKPASLRRGMVGELRGVPKPMLQIVFGKVLGRRIWEHTRRLAGSGVKSQVTPSADTNGATAGGGIPDAEIVGGMIAYVSRRAGETLRESGRQAKAIGLRIVYADGVSTLDRMRLARLTDEGAELAEAARDLLGRSMARGVAVASVDLRVTSIPAERAGERAGDLSCALVSAVAPGPSYLRVN
jgi:hypothetical protein